MMKLRRYGGEAGHEAGIGKATWEDEAITLRIIQLFTYTKYTVTLRMGLTDQKTDLVNKLWY
jgi:hypothetical protein